MGSAAGIISPRRFRAQQKKQGIARAGSPRYAGEYCFCGRIENMNIYWPIILIVVSNVFYNVCSKSTPRDVNPFASLTVTYALGAFLSGILYYCTAGGGGNLLQEYRRLNWSAFVLGIAVVGLEAGSIYMYKAGWNISTGQLVYSSALAVILIFIGYFFYHETISAAKAVGILICMVGLYFINR